MPTNDIAKKISERYSLFRDFVNVKTIENGIEIIYPSDWTISHEEIDNEIDLIEMWINDYI